MHVKFLGATHSVSGSCTLLKHLRSDASFLVDCGLYIGSGEAEWRNKQSFPFDPTQIRFVLLTHAHLDHCGLIPKLYKDGFVGKVYCTRATGELAKIVMLDCAINSTIYDQQHVGLVEFEYVDTRPNSGWGKQFGLAKDLRVSFLRGSHILGSSSICINWGFDDDIESKGKTILFTGDIGCNFEYEDYLPLLKRNQLPFPDTDYIVVESTYGGRKRDAKFKSDSNRLNFLKGVIISEVFGNNGKLFIPSFSIHRTQELIYDIYRVMIELEDSLSLKNHIEDRSGYENNRFSIYIDSPLGLKANKVFKDELFKRSSNGKNVYKNDRISDADIKALGEVFTENNIRFKDGIGFISVVDRSQRNGNKKNAKKSSSNYMDPRDIGSRASLVVASAGMCDAGPIVTYLEEFGDNPDNVILITGYQAEGSNGRAILEGRHEVIKSKVIDMSAYYSAHADENSLLHYIFQKVGDDRGKKTSVFINHGTTESKLALKSAIIDRASLKNDNDRKIGNILPLNGEQGWFDLNSGEEIVENIFDFEAEIAALHEKLDLIITLLDKQGRLN